MTTAQITPYQVQIPQSDLDDLATRLGATRWPDELEGAGTDYGMPVATIRRLARRWRDGFDWRAAEARLNELPQFTTTVDGQRLHFLHVRSTRPDATPLLLLHGWPGSVVEFLAMTGPLTEPAEGEPAFHVVVPSLPGYGFSGPTREPGWDSARMARAMASLMSLLGYQRWGAVGGDAGALVGRELGILAPAGLIGLHLLQIFAFPSGDPAEFPKMSEVDTAALTGSTAEFQAKSGYADIQRKRPATLAFALNDSPAGVLAWNAELWTGWGNHVEPVDDDTYLTHASIYWFTRTSGSSARHYYEDGRSGAGYREERNDVPTALAVFPHDFRTVRVFAQRSNNIVRYTEFDEGGHFAYTTHPQLVVDDIRAFFRSL